MPRHNCSVGVMKQAWSKRIVERGHGQHSVPVSDSNDMRSAAEQQSQCQLQRLTETGFISFQAR
ncbi:unnamed protein product [Protopolystoma xenopodis]|uniref:Uncharacterized protein n=1 Tax=Protopolystoma xenopodis TaxID=117903 RepID=A0A3S5C2E4_9PLAT|nr:unnamed protein product [Protopolystoma xenopodis]